MGERPETFIIKVKFHKAVNYTPRDVVSKWAYENYTPVFYDDYSKPYLLMYLYRFLRKRYSISLVQPQYPNPH